MRILIPDDFNLIFKCVAGSRLYGTNTPESDYDIRGVFIPSPEYIFGIKNVEQLEDKVNDVVYYEIRKFIRLASDCNPNIVELLFIHPESEYCYKFGKSWVKIYNNRSIFVSKKARWTFAGYAFSQLNRIKRHRSWLLNPPKNKPNRADFGLPEKKLVSNDQIGAFNVVLATYLKKVRDLHPLKLQIEEMNEHHDFLKIVQRIGGDCTDAIKKLVPVSDNFIEIMNKEKNYNQSLQHWNQYNNWKKNRNPERAVLEKKFGYDCKHACALVRLLHEGEELLTNGNITFPRPERDLLIEVRNGAWKYEKLIEFAENIEEKFGDLYEKSNLPNKPDVDEINLLLYNIINDC